jgi:transglutaminase-like putative cysteine protease
MKQILILLLCAVSSNLSAQSTEELFQKYNGEIGVYTKDYHQVNIYYEKGVLKASMDVEQEIMLIDETRAAALSVETVHDSYFSTLGKLEAATLIPTAKGFKSIPTTNIKTSPGTSGHVFYDDTKEKEIYYNNLSRGNRTSLKYTQHFRDIFLMSKVFLQNYLPTEHQVVSVTFPKSVKISEVFKGTDAPWLQKTVKENKQTITITWEGRQVPKAKFYADAPAVYYYLPHVFFLVQEYTASNSDKPVKVLSNADDLGRFLFDKIKNINQATGTDLKAKVKELTTGISNDKDKARAIFEWVQEHIRYIAFEDSLGGFVPREADVVFQRKFGDCKDKSSLLVMMCREAGLDARYVWIGTRDLPYSLKQTPMPGAFNHMIGAVKIEGQWVFLDATDNVTPYGSVPYSLQGKDAFIAHDGTDYEIVTIPVKNASGGIIRDSSYVRIENNMLTGVVHSDFKGYAAWEVQQHLMYMSEKDKEKVFSAITSRGNNKYAQKSFDYVLEKDKQKSLHINASFELKDYIKNVGDDYYINMHLLKPFADGKIETQTRKAPVNFDFNQTLQYTVVLEIPKGYKVSYVPENEEHNFKGLGAYRVSYQQNGTLLTLKSEFTFEKLMIEESQFKEYNLMIAALQKAYKETIELSKIK